MALLTMQRVSNIVLASNHGLDARFYSLFCLLDVLPAGWAAYFFYDIEYDIIYDIDIKSMISYLIL